jgi:uncharacterized protein (TIGR03435 family)
MLIAVGLADRPAAAQDIAGTWQGTLHAGKDQRIVVKIAKEGGDWKGLVYNLDSYMAYEGRATTQMGLQGAEVRFAIAPIDASYEGKLSGDAASIAGTWTQGGQAQPLNLVRAEGDAEWEIPKMDAAMAKDADPDWEVVTVRPLDPNDPHPGSSIMVRGREFVIENKTVETMLLFGYGVHQSQIAGAPDWMRTERWYVKGVPDAAGHPSLKQMQTLTRKVLVERFGLQMHTEQRELPVYAITVAKGGEKIAKSAGDPSGVPQENDRENGGERLVQMTNASMGDFALLMKFLVDRPVVDQTGLTGRYDFQLKWTFDESKAPTDGSAPPSLFTAIQEQMGLKLEAVKAQAEVLVVDKVERPSAN